jgi:hypothetical protein
MPIQARLLAVTALACLSAVSSALADGAPDTVTVKSSLDGLTTLPVRLHWEATPVAAPAPVTQALFQIDGKDAWLEHNAPYDYGDDGGWLVTTFLKPGTHTFTVRIDTADGHSATDTVTATVSAPPAPPPALAGTKWSRNITSGDKGRWRITTNRVGWLFDDPHGGGQNQDVSYPSRGRVTIRSAIEEPILGQYNRGGAFCGIEPDPPVTYSYAVSKHHRRLRLRAIGAARNDCRTGLLQGAWTRTH